MKNIKVTKKQYDLIYDCLIDRAIKLKTDAKDIEEVKEIMCSKDYEEIKEIMCKFNFDTIITNYKEN